MQRAINQQAAVNSTPLFKIGDRIRIVASAGSLFAGVEGVVDNVKPHPRNLSQLDLYTVLFGWGEKKTFWGAQLERSQCVVNPRADVSRIEFQTLWNSQRKNWAGHFRGASAS